MVQGGIQGDEPAGVITAALLRNARVKKGNLLLVPRANVPALNRDKRLVNVDLNRRFDRDYARFYEDVLARAIKFLAVQTDGLVHLHEGSGFYSPEYVSKLRNPDRYGQSVIIDSAEYSGVSDLQETAQTAIERVNSDVTPPEYMFTLFNTHTSSRNTKHAEQRKSFTFYSLDHLGQPALAVEASKSIRDLAWKVRHQTLVCREILRNLGVVVEPVSGIEEKVDSWFDSSFPLRINGQDPSELREIDLRRTSPLRVDLTRESAKSWGVYASSMPGVNLLHTRVIPLTQFRSLEIRMDGRVMRTLRVDWAGPEPQGAGKAPLLVYCRNGRVNFAPPGEEIQATEGDSFYILGLWEECGQEVLNVKGFVSNRINNDGQDKRSRFLLFPDRFIRRYLHQEENGWSTRIVRETPGKRKNEWPLSVNVPDGPQFYARKKKTWCGLHSQPNRNLLVPGIYELGTRKGKEALFDVQGKIGPRHGAEFELSAGETAEIRAFDPRTFSSWGKINVRGKGKRWSAHLFAPKRP